MKAGDFIQIEYTGRVKESGEIFDTTDEALAKKNGIHSNKGTYGPVTVIVGAGYVLPGLDKKLPEIEPGESAKFEVSPDDAFGKRDPKLVQLSSLAQFRKQRIVPIVGQYLTVGRNLSGKILSVSSGRVKIDFNHPLSGKVLEYEVKNLGLVEDAKKRVDAVVDFYLGAFSKMAETTAAETRAEISLPKQVLEFVSKEVRDKIEEDIKKYVPGIAEISFLEKKIDEAKEQGQKKPEGTSK